MKFLLNLSVFLIFFSTFAAITNCYSGFYINNGENDMMMMQHRLSVDELQQAKQDITSALNLERPTMRQRTIASMK